MGRDKKPQTERDKLRPEVRTEAKHFNPNSDLVGQTISPKPGLIATIVIIILVTIVSFVFYFTGSLVSQNQVVIVRFLLSFIVGIVFWVGATVEGQLGSFKIRTAGGIACFIVSLLVLHFIEPRLYYENYTFSLKKENGESLDNSFDIKIYVEGLNYIPAKGSDGIAVVPLPAGLTNIAKVVIENCVDYIVKPNQTFVIKPGAFGKAVDIVVKRFDGPPSPDSWPTVNSSHLPNDDDLSKIVPSDLDPNQITLRYVNNTGRNLELLLLSCKKYMLSKNTKAPGAIEPEYWSKFTFPHGKQLTFKGFGDEDNETMSPADKEISKKYRGWYSFLIRDPSGGEAQFLGKEYLYRGKEVKLAVQRDDKNPSRPYKAVFSFGSN